MSEVIEIEWKDLLDRLSHHRERLFLSKEEVADYIKSKYGKGFWKLTNDEILELGKTMSECKTGSDFFALMPRN